MNPYKLADNHLAASSKLTLHAVQKYVTSPDASRASIREMAPKPKTNYIYMAVGLWSNINERYNTIPKSEIKTLEHLPKDSCLLR